MEHVCFKLEGTKVVQTEPDGSVTEFDPYSWGSFLRGTRVVHATQIPRTFRVGGDICLDGYLVFEGPDRLFPISTRTFGADYEPMQRRLAAAA